MSNPYPHYSNYSMRLNTKKKEHAVLNENIQTKLDTIRKDYQTDETGINPLIILMDILISHYDNNPPIIHKDRKTKTPTLEQIKQVIQDEFYKNLAHITEGSYRSQNIAEVVNQVWDETAIDEDTLNSFLEDM